MEQHNKFMKEAIRQAKKAAKLDEVPIGCVITYEDRIIEGFTMPRPQRIMTSDVYHHIDPLIAFLEEIGEYTVTRDASWLVI